MKKRLLSALLALALVFVLLPTTALAGEVNGRGDISIAGKDWNFTKNTSGYETVYYQVQSKSGVFSTSLENKTGCVYPTNPYLEITRKGNTITVIVHGAVTITTNKGTNNAAEECIEVNKSDNQTTTLNLVITGVEGTKNNTLTLECKGYGSALSSYQGDITITGGVTVNANSTYSNSNTGVSARAINVFNGDLTISGTGTTVNAENRDSHHPTIDVKNAVTISDGATLTAKNTSGDKAISFGSITADGYDFKYWTTSGYTTLTGEDKATNIQTYSRIKLTPTVIEKDSYVYIAGGPAVVGVRTSLGEGNGYYTYNKDTKTFTLENVNITSVINAIQLMADGTYTINLVGTNTISDVSAGIVASNLYGANDITAVLSGTGSLDITAGHYAIDMQKVGNLKFENTGTIKLTTGYKYPASTCNALYVVGNVTIDTTKYGITGQKQAQGFPTEDIGNSPVFETILKGTDSTLYFKTITIAPKPSKTYYNGTAMKYGETKTVGNGTISCDENGVITLNGVTEGTLEFRSSADSTLVLEGTNTLSSIVTTQKSLTISGSGSLTAGSIRVPNNTQHTANLTINGATVTVGTAELTTRAIDVNGSLTVTGASLTATSKSDSVPTVQVGGNASFTGSTVTITNNSTTQGKSGEYSYAVSTGLYVGGTLDIKNAAKVTSTVIGGNAIYAKGDITISGDGTKVEAQNSAYKFSAISTNGTVNISDNSTVKAENGKKHQGDPTGVTDPSTGKTYNACPAITGKIANKNTQNKLHIEGFTTSSAGSQNPTEGTPLNLDIAPGSVEPYIHHYNVTITRGDKVTRTNSPVVIAGTTLLNDTFYTINGSTVAEGTESNYNAFYNSTTKTLKLNNAQISHSFAHEYGGGQDGAIIFKEFENYFIELSGENTISSTNTYAINCYRPDRTLTIKNAAEAENAKLTLTSNWMVICSIGGLNIQSDVTMVNTKEAGYLMYVNDTFSFDGYNAYASVNASGSPLVEYTVPTSGDKDAGYQYLRITKETLETGGGSTHEHVFSTSWESNADYHWHKCTVQGCTEVSDKEEHVYTNTWWKNSNGNHGRTCDKCRHEGEIHEFRKYYNFVDATYHVERCSYPNCTYVGSNETHSYDSFGTCKCGYNPNGLPAPPSLQGVAPTSENGTDGKILNSNIGMEYAQNLNGPWTKWNEHSNITGLSAGTYYVRYTKTDERFPDNQVATVEVPAYTPGGDPTPDIPAAPTGLVGVAPTSENGNGKITGTTAQMEYASSLEGDWTTCANDSTDVPAGKYYVRMKKTDNTPAGEVVEVTVPAYSGTGEITPDPTPDNPGTIVIIRPAEEEKPAQQPNPSTGANDLVGLAVAAAVAAALGSAALLRKHD